MILLKCAVCVKECGEFKEKKVFAIYQLVKKERKAEILSSYLFSRCFSEISGV